MIADLTRWIKEAFWIHRKGKNTLNKDEGAYKLSNIFDQLIHTTPSTAASSSYKRMMLSGQGYQFEEAASFSVQVQIFGFSHGKNPKNHKICEKMGLFFKKNQEKVYFRSQILERPSIIEYLNISGVPVLPENVIFTFFRMCWCYSEAYNTGMQKWFSIVQYSCTSIWDLKYTFSKNP